MAEKVLMPALSPTMETGTILKWVKAEGEVVQSGDVLCQVETDKATMEYEAQNEGTLLKIVVPEGGEVRVGNTIAIVGERGEDISALLDEIEEEKGPAVESREGVKEKKRVFESEKTSDKRLNGKPEVVSDVKLLGGVKASPVARSLAKEHELDLALIKGSGPGGRIVKRDVELFIEAQPKSKDMEVQGKVETVLKRIPVSGMRKVIAKRLSQSKFTAPHYYLKSVVQVDTLFESRKMINAGLKDEKLSLNAFLIKFVAEALKRHPMVNAGWEGDYIVQFGSADIGIAVALPDGLIAPVVRDCWNKGILQIDRELRTLVEKAYAKKLMPEEYTGATFTISNLGSYGIREFTAIINPPGSAILAVGEASKQPVVEDDDRIVVKTNIALTLSCDHRVIDGAVGALFLKDLQRMIENPVAALV